MFARGKRALGVCDVCGLVYKLTSLKPVIDNKVETGLRACRDCWDPDHPQNEVGWEDIYDPQALEDPRPDNRLSSGERDIYVELPVTVVAVRVKPVEVA